MGGISKDVVASIAAKDRAVAYCGTILEQEVKQHGL